MRYFRGEVILFKKLIGRTGFVPCMTGISLLAGLVTAEVTHQVAQRLDDTNEQIEKLLSGEEVTEQDLQQAIKLLSEDKSKLQKLYDGLRTELLERGKGEAEVNRAMEPVKSNLA